MSRALWHLSPTRSELRPVSLPPTGSNLCEVESLYSLISTGTERLVATGQVPDQMNDSMAIPYMEGNLGLPVKYGYSLVGRVATAGHPWDGKVVHLLHPHQDRCWVKPGALSLVPDGVPPKRASLASNLETAVNAVWDSGLSIGDRVLITGFGMIGALISRITSRVPATEVWIAETNARRAVFARNMGFQVLSGEDMINAFDMAFNTSGTSAGLQKCIDFVNLEGTVVELSWYGTREVTLQLGGDFHHKRKRLISSQVSTIPPGKTARWDYKRRKSVVFELLKSPLFDEHISHLVPFTETPDLFDKIRKNEIDGIGYCVEY